MAGYDPSLWHDSSVHRASQDCYLPETQITAIYVPFFLLSPTLSILRMLASKPLLQSSLSCVLLPYSCTVEHECWKREEKPCLLVELFLQSFAASALSLYDSGEREIIVYTLATKSSYKRRGNCSGVYICSKHTLKSVLTTHCMLRSNMSKMQLLPWDVVQLWMMRWRVAKSFIHLTHIHEILQGTRDFVGPRQQSSYSWTVHILVEEKDFQKFFGISKEKGLILSITLWILTLDK